MSTPDVSTPELAGRTLVMSGGSRGIGLAIAVAAARRGVNSVLLAKTDRPDPRLPGTVHTAVEEITAAGRDSGARAVAVVGDVRAEADVQRAVATAVDTFGGLDVVVNNASALDLTPTAELSAKRYDLMQQVNSRGTWLLTRTALPHLAVSSDAQVLTLSPPVDLAPRWLGMAPAYTLSKYGMTLLTLGFAAELAGQGVRANCLWPRTTIATAAVVNLIGGEELAGRSRSPAVVGDAAVALLADPSRPTGRTFVDDEVLRAAGITDLSVYGGGQDPQLDWFVDPA